MMHRLRGNHWNRRHQRLPALRRPKPKPAIKNAIIARLVRGSSGQNVKGFVAEDIEEGGTWWYLVQNN
jgi:hypothetical protein